MSSRNTKLINGFTLDRSTSKSSSFSSHQDSLIKTFSSEAGNRDAINLVLASFRADNGRSASTASAAYQDHLRYFYERTTDLQTSGTASLGRVPALRYTRVCYSYLQSLHLHDIAGFFFRKIFQMARIYTVLSQHERFLETAKNYRNIAENKYFPILRKIRK